MAGATTAAAIRQVERLFGEGTLLGLNDRALLERFLARRDEAAFEAIVARHGPMVLGVCRRILRDDHAAEDAFQATFLILARQAGGIRGTGSLGGWLRRVGRRVAYRAARRMARQGAGDPQGAEPLAPAGASPEHRELLVALREEIGRLPGPYREPIVLCDLEEITRDEAAQRLGWPAGTVAGRLARARALLGDRLRRRGLDPQSSLPVLPAALARRLATDAVAFASSHAEVSLLSPASVLAWEILSAAQRARRLALAAGVLLAGGLAAGTYGFGFGRAEPPATPPADPPRSAVMAVAREDDKDRVLTGEVRPAPGGSLEGARAYYSVRDAGQGWGHVLAEGDVGADGRFRLDLPPEDEGFRRGFSPALWIYRPGSLVALRAIRPGDSPENLGAGLVLSPPARAEFLVEDREGKPVAGATIEPRVLNRQWASVPDTLAERIAQDTVTDAQGRAILQAFLPEDIITVIVTAPGFGRQQFGFDRLKAEPSPKRLKLLPAGSLRGRLIGEPATIAGRPLDITVSCPPERVMPPAPALIYLTTDDQGRFAVPELLAGKLRITDEPALGSRWYVEGGRDLDLEAGRENTFELRLAQGIPVRGVVRERGTGRPVAAVKVSYLGGGGTETTDDQGVYRGYTRPGPFRPAIHFTPPSHAGPTIILPQITVPDDAAEVVVPPIELSPAGVVRGQVINAGGEPVLGAEIAAEWPVVEGPGRRGTRQALVRSDARGRFVVEQVELGAEVRLIATKGGLRTANPTAAQADGEPATMQVDDVGVAISGRVVDDTSRPIAGARVHIREQVPQSASSSRSEDLVEFPGGVILITDADGRFRTPRVLFAGTKYAAFAVSEGRRYARTDWTPADQGEFPDLALPPD